MGHNLPTVSGTIDVDALAPVSGEIHTGRSGPRFPRPRLTRMTMGSGSESLPAITEARDSR
ncbi:MAG: hypothetical protein ABI591_17570 [Kofleriaceae bacterium]